MFIVSYRNYWILLVRIHITVTDQWNLIKSYKNPAFTKTNLKDDRNTNIVWHKTKTLSHKMSPKHFFSTFLFDNLKLMENFLFVKDTQYQHLRIRIEGEYFTFNILIKTGRTSYRTSNRKTIAHSSHFTNLSKIIHWTTQMNMKLDMRRSDGTDWYIKWNGWNRNGEEKTKKENAPNAHSGRSWTPYRRKKGIKWKLTRHLKML